MAMNPIRIARNMENLSQSALARRLGLSRPFIVRAEQGCYDKPGTPLTHYCARVMKINPTQVLELYHLFQSSQRKETLAKHAGIETLAAPVAAPLELDDKDREILFNHQLFQRWREGYWNTVTDFSVAMCVHPYSVAHYEDGDMYGMPKQLFEVLTETGLIDPSFNKDVRWYYAAA